MKTIDHGDDLMGALLVQAAPFTRQLDGPFIGLCPAVGEEHPLKATVGG